MHSTFERPFKPTEFTPGAIESFDLQNLANQLMMEKSFVEHGRSGLTLTRDDNHTTVLTVAKGGAGIQEHSSAGPTTLVMLSGSMTLMADQQNQQISLVGGMAVAFAPDVSHHIAAHTDCAFLIMIGGKL